MMPTIAEAVWELAKNASFKVHGDTYEDVEWEDTERTLPSKSAVMAKLAELQAQYEAEQQAAEAAKQAAQDKLSKLGLTPEDLKMLLG
jgi:hypothetical protein